MTLPAPRAAASARRPRYLPHSGFLYGSLASVGVMVDPTSDLVDDEDPPDCERCGDSAGGPGRRVVTSVEDGVVEYRHFCSPGCADDAD